MTTWSLEPGCERPVPGFTRARGAHVSTPKLDLTPNEMVARLRELGAKVEVFSDKIRVYPPDPDCKPFNLSNDNINFKKARGNHRAQVITTLRRAGLDVMVPTTEEPPVPSPADLPQSRSEPRPPLDRPRSTDDLLSLVVELEERLAAVEGVNADLDARIGRLERNKETVRAELDMHLQAIETLSPARPPKTANEIVRDLVLAYLQAHPGQKLPPDGVAANIEDELPEGASATAVASACAWLVRQGQLQTKAKGPQMIRALYWYEPKAETE
jgi:hypothetical protein